MRRLWILMALLGLVIAPVQADTARDRLDHFFQEMESFQADFEQVVLTEQDEVMQATEGRVYLKRPNQFRWNYEKPYTQQIIADGQFLWTYDEDLAQATVQEMDAVLGRTPVMLLSQPRPLEEDFHVEEQGEIEGMNWLALTPREAGSDFERLLIGMDEGQVRMMVLYDQFGQQTRIRFGDMDINPDIPAARFRFEPPPGVDVMHN